MESNGACRVVVGLLLLLGKGVVGQADFRECDNPQCSASPWDTQIGWDFFNAPAFCEMELLYGIAGVVNETMGARFSIVNNSQEDVATWQVVWTFEDYEDLSVDSTKGAILLSSGSAYGGPARVVNTQENSVVNGNGSHAEFTIATLFSEGTLNEVDSFDIRDVSVNGMRCAPVEEGICQVPLCSSALDPPQALLEHVGTHVPSCMSIFCCGDKLAVQNNVKDEKQCFSELPTAGENTTKSGGIDPEEQQIANFNVTEEIPPTQITDEEDLGTPPAIEISPPSEQENEDMGPRKKVTMVTNILLTGSLILLLLVGLFAIIMYWLRRKSNMKKTDHSGTQLTSEIKHLTSVIHPSVSATSTELWESTIDALKPKSYLDGKLLKGSSVSRSQPQRTSSVASSATSRGLNSNHLKSKGSSVSKEDQSQGVFDINFARDVVLGRKLGSGAFGSVFQGTWRSEQVAVKMVPIVSTDDGHGDRELESLKSEIEVLSRLQHPNIICFYGACLVPPHICILEELATCSLASRLHGDMGTEMPLKYAEVLRLATDICSAMAYLHPNVVHRDLKPQNVLLDSQCHAKVCDFGIAKFKESTFMTTQNASAGTPAYMAPEMFEGVALTEKVDVFSFGVMMWESYTGLIPWKEYDNPMQIIYAVGVQGKRLPIPGDCPPYLCRLIQSAWHQDPQKRPFFVDILSSLEEELQKIAMR